MTLGWLVLAGLLALSLARKHRLAPVWLAAAGYAVACQVPIYLMRSSTTASWPRPCATWPTSS